MTTGENAWVLIPLGIAAGKVIELLVTTGWKKVFGNHYVTRQECENCRKECHAAESAVTKEFKEDMQAMRAVMITIAQEMKIPADKWERLVK